MNINYNKAIPLVKEALNHRALRQDLVASNIANVDTPFYKSKDILFENILSKKSEEIFNNSKSKILEMAKTNSEHMGPVGDIRIPSIYFRDGHMSRNDGNSVDLDVETTEMAKNNVMYNALISGLKKSGSIFTNVIDSSGKLQ